MAPSTLGRRAEIALMNQHVDVLFQGSSSFGLFFLHFIFKGHVFTQNSLERKTEFITGINGEDGCPQGLQRPDGFLRE